MVVESNSGSRTLRKLFLDAGGQALSSGRAAEGEELLLAAAEEGRGLQGLDRPAEPFLMLARLYRGQGKAGKAEPHYKKAVQALEQFPGNAELDEVLFELGELYRQLRKPSLAKPLLENRLIERERSLGPDHIDLCGLLAGLSELCISQKDYAQADTYAKRRLAILERVLGPYHLDVAAGLEKVANLCHLSGKKAEAEHHYKRVLDIKEKAFGAGTPAVADCLDNLAVHYSIVGDAAKAEESLKRALEIREKSLGPEDLRVAETLEDLANLCGEQGRDEQGAGLRERAKMIKQKIKKR